MDEVKFPGGLDNNTEKNEGEIIELYASKSAVFAQILKELNKVLNSEIKMDGSENYAKQWKIENELGVFDLEFESGNIWLINWYLNEGKYIITINFARELIYVNDIEYMKTFYPARAEDFKAGYYTKWGDYMGADYEEAKYNFCNRVFGDIRMIANLLSTYYRNL